MSNIITIPTVIYDDIRKMYYQNGNQMINLDNVSIIEQKYYNDSNQLSRYIIYFSKDVYTYTNQKGYDLIKKFENKIYEKSKDTIL